MKKTIVTIIGLLISLSLVSPKFVQADRQPQGSGISAQATEPVPTPASTPTLSPKDPRDSAREWLTAVTDQDEEKLLNLTCAARQDELKQTSPWLLAFPALEDNELFKLRLEDNPEMDISKLTFETPNPNETQVKVHMAGKLQMNSPGFSLQNGGSGFSSSQRIEVRWWLVHEVGMWRWCGAIRGEATPTPRPSPTPRPVRSTQSTPTATGIWGCLNGFLGIVFGLLFPLVMIISQLWDYLNKRNSNT